MSEKTADRFYELEAWVNQQQVEIDKQSAQIGRLQSAIHKYLSHQVSHAESYRMFRDALQP